MNQQGMLADALRQQIIDGAFAPGSRLSESALAEHFGVARNTLREAVSYTHLTLPTNREV